MDLIPANPAPKMPIARPFSESPHVPQTKPPRHGGGTRSRRKSGVRGDGHQENDDLVALVESGDIDGIQQLLDKAGAAGDQTLTEQIVELRAQLEAAHDEIRRQSPMADWPYWENADDVIAQLGDDGILAVAMEEIRAENRDRLRRHAGSLYQTEAEQVELAKSLLERIAAAMVAEQTRGCPTTPSVAVSPSWDAPSR
jgi:hypothetical protein